MKLKIAVTGPGYIGFSLAVILSHNKVTIVNIIFEKIDHINNWKRFVQNRLNDRKSSGEMSSREQ